MNAWFESVVGPEYASAVMWMAIAVAALILLLIILRVLRSLSSGTFVMGGRNRKARLAVMDATAVDANRRLVLVRRDDVEHLILIGGPTDVVVEQGIRPHYAPARREEPTAPEQPRVAPPSSTGEASAAATPRPAPRAAETASTAQAAAAPSTASAALLRQEPPVRQMPPAPAPAPAVRPQPTPASATASMRSEPTMDGPASGAAPFGTQSSISRAPAIEPAGLDVNIPSPQQASTRPETARAKDGDEVSLEEEMNRLLGNLSPSSSR